MKTLITILTILLTSAFAHAHGEDKPGPHGGYIKMPANFHTELVPVEDGSFKIYLIDLQFQNPTIDKSSVKVTATSGKKKTAMNCMPMNDHFHCKSKKPLKISTLLIKATREGTAATMDAKYSFPLKAFDNTTTQAPKTENHSNH